ncbi:pilus assembly protein [Actinotalea subterranea]|uniref:pilus assembly protein n=1 Tax=Actinotalea subterranea TaxID=2607497 RepID=UPI001CAA830A|nr:pilus assembly protein [Actinotalea subterranea]
MFVAVSMVGLLLIIGLIADGGVKVRAVQEADALAAEAARASGQAIDLPAAVGGEPVRVDRQAAANAANAYLTAADAPGQVSISPDGRDLEVSVTLTRPTAFLSLIGITQVTVTGHASVTLVHAVTGDQP